MSTDLKMETTFISTLKELEQGLESLYMSIMGENEVAGVKCVVGVGFVQMSDSGSIDGLKFATAQMSLWIDLHRLCYPKHLPLALRRFLKLPDLTFVGVGIKHGLDALEESYGVMCVNAVDLRSLAADVDSDKRIQHYGLLDLAHRFCNIKVKPELLRGHAKAALFARDKDEANVRFILSIGRSANVGTVDAHLAFMIGNRLLGGAMPYNIPWYNTTT